MKVLLAFLFTIYVLSIRAAWRGRESRAWWVLGGAFVVSTSYYFLRFI